MPSEKKEPVVNGITLSDYQSWRHHPVTKVFHGYLRDFREALQREMLAAFEDGSLVLSSEHEARGRSRTLIEVAELPFAAIQTFYREEEETDDEAETD